MKRIAIIAAAGKGTRAGADKIWIKWGGKTMIERTLEPFLVCFETDEIILVVAKAREREAKELCSGANKPIKIVVGGETRTQSVRYALAQAKEDAAGEPVLVAVHDGARPYVTVPLIQRCFAVAQEHGSAVPVLPCSDSLRLVTEKGSNAISREGIRLVQTPQCFSLSALLKAYESGEEATDDAALYEKHIGAVTLTEGDPNNIKITYLSDILKEKETRVGVGFDVHPLALGRKLVLGGIVIEHDKGLMGHSDADALAHAIMDALLTAADLPDIGHLFPPEDPAYEGADSMLLLKKVTEMLQERGWRVENVSAEILAEKPKLAPYIGRMESRVAQTIGIETDRVKFAATTTEKLGIIGEEKGIAAHAVALIASSVEPKRKGDGYGA